MAYNLANETEPISIRELAQKLASISDRGQVPVSQLRQSVSDRNLSPVRMFTILFQKLTAIINEWLWIHLRLKNWAGSRWFRSKRE